jgi:hypothetical protein
MNVQARDLVYSNARDLVGVVRSVDDKRKTAVITIGHGTFQFYQAGEELVRPHWDADQKTYRWEKVYVLTDAA